MRPPEKVIHIHHKERTKRMVCRLVKHLQTYLLLSPVEHTHGVDVEWILRQPLLSHCALADGQRDVHRLQAGDERNANLKHEDNFRSIWYFKHLSLTWEGASGKTLSFSLLGSSVPAGPGTDGFSGFFSTGTHSPYAPSASFFLCWEPEDTGNSLANAASDRTAGFTEVFWNRRGTHINRETNANRMLVLAHY